MPARIRLQRYGKKGKPFFHIVIADGRAPRDGRFIEKIGTYNPLTNPADINIDVDRAMTWLKNGAQPSETARAILAYRGVLYKYHLQKGVLKGALTQEQADAKFEAWLQEKDAKIRNKKLQNDLSHKNDLKARLDAESKVNLKKAEALQRKRSQAAAALEAAALDAVPATEVEEAQEEAQEEVQEETQAPAEESPAAEENNAPADNEQ